MAEFSNRKSEENGVGVGQCKGRFIENKEGRRNRRHTEEKSQLERERREKRRGKEVLATALQV